MERTPAQEYAKDLRAVAKWFDEHPEMAPCSDSLAVYAYDTKEEAAKCLRALGTCTKEYNDWSFTLVKSFGGVKLKYVFTRQNVCERKVVGVKTIPAEFVPAHTIPAREEEIVEWDCGPVLSPEMPLEEGEEGYKPVEVVDE